MTCRLLALDIDGTLITDDRRITPRTVSAIHAVMRQGVHVTLCTGRSISTSAPIVAHLPLNAPLVLNGGALIHQTHPPRALYLRNLNKTMALKAVDRLRSLGCHPVVYSPLPESRHFYYDHPNPENRAFREYIARNPGRAQQVSDVAEAVYGDTALVAISDLAPRIRALAPVVQNLLPETTVTLEISPIDRAYCHLTLTPTGVSKGGALRELALLLGVGLSDVVAIGDNLNDLDMLKVAGLGVAMGNATPETKAHAGYTTDSNNEDGVAKFIERFILKDQG
ncbi:MAG: HAD family phosphatase [candidate division Zixibacteria bacterium]|nr:HAD family phosphatase [candidate division Zixibacteria bacterium]